MYDICPKCNYQRTTKDTADRDSCPACGVIYAKWLKSRLAMDLTLKNAVNATGRNRASAASPELAYLPGNEKKINPFVFWSRLLLLVILAAWGWRFIQMDFVINPFQIGRSFMHNINLIFHEAGHILFMPFGRFMSILGGSLFQVLVPLVVMLVFLVKNRNPFATSVGLWWTGQSMMDLAPYIDDAIDQKLVLLGGRTGADAPGNHDWGNILIDLDMLEKHRQIASFVDGLGSLLIIMAITWGSVVLYRQFGNIDKA